LDLDGPEPDTPNRGQITTRVQINVQLDAWSPRTPPRLRQNSVHALATPPKSTTSKEHLYASIPTQQRPLLFSVVRLLRRSPNNLTSTKLRPRFHIPILAHRPLSPRPPGGRAATSRHVTPISPIPDALWVREDSIPSAERPDGPHRTGQDQEGEARHSFPVSTPRPYVPTGSNRR
jgi:hypothetical protein